MTPPSGRLLLLALFAHVGACASAPAAPPAPSLSARIDAVIDAPPLDQVHWGVLVVDAASGRALYERDSQKKFAPASNMKLMTTASALSLLGPDFRFRTAVYGAGALTNGVLSGDLVLVGSGDPTMSERFYPSAVAPLDSLADSLLALGVRTVTGNLVVDVSRWDSTSVPATWMVEDVRWPWGATGGAFAVAEGELALEVVPGEVGQAPAVTWISEARAAGLDNRLVTVPLDSTRRIEPLFRPGSETIELLGRVRAGVADTVRLAMRDPVGLSARVLFDRLRRRGIEIEGGLRIAWIPDEETAGGCRSSAVPSCPGARSLATLASPPLAEVIEGILEPSQNWMTEQLLRTLGAELGEEGSWREGFEVLSSFLIDEVHVDSLDFVLRDGSGLSAYNLVTPRGVVRLLDFMRRGPHATAFRNALAEPGEEDGTLERRLEGLEGRLFAKTGTITHVNSLSGYLVADDGSEVLFSILTNGSGLPAPTVRRAIDELVRLVAVGGKG